ncbi:hypothetical protein BsWGS_02483 [Bradybaena similaris]
MKWKRYYNTTSVLVDAHSQKLNTDGALLSGSENITNRHERCFTKDRHHERCSTKAKHHERCPTKDMHYKRCLTKDRHHERYFTEDRQHERCFFKDRHHERISTKARHHDFVWLKGPGLWSRDPEKPQCPFLFVVRGEYRQVGGPPSCNRQVAAEIYI